MRDPYAALDAFFLEHRLCRPGLDDPDVSPMLVALWCSCGAKLIAKRSKGEKPDEAQQLLSHTRPMRVARPPPDIQLRDVPE
jgi:hypothetical protein